MHGKCPKYYLLDGKIFEIDLFVVLILLVYLPTNVERMGLMSRVSGY